MVVVTNPEPIRDEVADHRTGPDARLVTRGDRPALDEHRQGGALQLGQLRLRTFRDRRPEAVNVIGVVPLQPAIHRPARDSPIGGYGGNPSTINVRPNGAPPSPLRQVVLELRLEDELVQPFELSRAPTSTPDRMSCLGLRHDRETMILSRSAVKPGSQAVRSCLAKCRPTQPNRRVEQ